MMNQLSRAKEQIEKLQNEVQELNTLEKEERARIPFGQPNIIGRGDIYKTANRLFDKQIKKLNKIEEVENRIEKLEKVERFKQKNDLLKDVHVVGKTNYATVGAKTSVNNLDYFRNKLEELIKTNEENKAYNKTKPKIKRPTHGAEITKLKKKVAYLEDMAKKDKEKVLSDKSQKLIDENYVNQWKKKPIYYFVKGLQKVALELDEQGNFYVSKRYPVKNEDEQEIINQLLS